jgi:hypothetical protein
MGGNTHDFNSIAKTISRVRAEFLGRSLEDQSKRGKVLCNIWDWKVLAWNQGSNE